MTLTTTFVNKTMVDFKLKEGNAGVYRELCTLHRLRTADAEPSAENKLTMRFDDRSTYKEFRAATVSRPGRKLLISSDFILDNAIVYIVQEPPGSENYFVKGDLRTETRTEILPMIARLFNLFKRNRSNP